VTKSITISWAEHVALKGREEVYTGKTEGKGPLGIPRHRWEENIILDLQEVGWGYGLDYSGSGQGQVAVSCKCSNKSSGSIKLEKFLDQLRTG
jgi:hypothetical protein